jgi:hypothetical protein
MCLFGYSCSFTELLFTGNICLCATSVYLRDCYLQVICVGVERWLKYGAPIYMKYMLVWDQLYI